MPRKKAQFKRKAASPGRKRRIQTLTGMRDILSDDYRYFEWVIRRASEMAEAYGYRQIVTPILEQTQLFERAVGADTDIVEKELFAFKDKGRDYVALRPEMTASMVRSYIQHGMLNLPQPVKLYQYGPCFRHEKPQSGRYRQFFQFDIEALGSSDPGLDAEVIILVFNILKSLGLSPHIQINSIGTPNSRQEYKKLLVKYCRKFRSRICQNCKKRLKKNPLRLLDCKTKQCQSIIEGTPQIIDYLDRESQADFEKVLDYLEESDLAYSLNPKLVRGLDYYTKTTFEIFSADEEEKSTGALVGGGRYDGLAPLLGGRETPGIGWALGLERVVARLKEKKIEPEQEIKYDIFLAQIGEKAKQKSFQLFDELRSQGVRIVNNISKQGLRAQLTLANKYQVQYSLILGQKEIVDNTVIIRDMESGMQEIVACDKIVKEVQKRLK